MMRDFKSRLASRLTLLLVLLILAPFGSLTAAADDLGALRDSGAIGERYDGLVEARDPSARGKVDEVNAKRRALYARNAAAQGVTVEQVGQVYAAEIFKRLNAGNWFKRKSGDWIRK